MVKIKFVNRFLLGAVLCILTITFLEGCKREQYPILTSNVLNITQYLQSKPDQFSLFEKIVEKSGYSGFLGAYGAYTLFAPTDDGVKLYLKTVNKASVDQIDANTCKDLVKIHLIQDTLRTGQFTDGKLPSITMYGQYLTTGAANVNGTTKITINRQANLVQGNVKAGNGIIHVIDNMLTPATLTLAQMLEQNSRYSIFTQALKQTGFYDTLNVAANSSTNANRKFFTVFAETDSTFKAAGINSYADMQRRYSATGNPKNPADSLYLFMAYHTTIDIRYLADVISSPSIATLAPQEVITTSINGQSILLNETTFNGIAEPGVTVNRGYSDITATNGVLHAANTNFTIKKRSPTAVYFDVADQPELRKMTSVFRKNGQFVALNYGQLAGVTWDRAASTINYTCDPTTSANYHIYYDHLDFGLRFGNAAVINWIEFTTPLLVKGQYKVWMCYRVGVQGQYVQVSVDGNPLSRIVNMYNTGSSTGYLPDVNATDEILEGIGFKRYAASAPATNNTQVGQLAGTVNITSTDRHKIRLTSIKDAGSGAAGITLDMIQFIPVNQDQVFPKFYRDGTQLKR
ncbi:MAG: fasciclin domain-containing protein [Sphingobacteriaceae bacterium]|nr:MAG: fasciclin domain-containing protein [Sphingobacteriaceae bacterium]